MEEIIKDIIASPQFLENTAWCTRDVEENEVIVKQGELGDALYYVIEGSLSVISQVELAEHRNIKPGIFTMTKGDVFGEASLHQAGIRMATVSAISTAKLIQINGEKLAIYLDAHPIIGYLFYKKLFAILISRLDKANHRVEHLMAWGLKAHNIEQHL